MPTFPQKSLRIGIWLWQRGILVFQAAGFGKKGTKIGIEGSNSTKKKPKKNEKGSLADVQRLLWSAVRLHALHIAHGQSQTRNDTEFRATRAPQPPMGTSVFILRNLGKQSVRSPAQRLAHWPWAEAPDLAEATRCQCLLKTLAQWKGGTGTTNISGHRKCTNEWK